MNDDKILEALKQIRLLGALIYFMISVAFGAGLGLWIAWMAS
jgi:hypothetical protein